MGERNCTDVMEPKPESCTHSGTPSATEVKEAQARETSRPSSIRLIVILTCCQCEASICSSVLLSALHPPLLSELNFICFNHLTKYTICKQYIPLLHLFLCMCVVGSHVLTHIGEVYVIERIVSIKPFWFLRSAFHSLHFKQLPASWNKCLTGGFSV